MVSYGDYEGIAINSKIHQRIRELGDLQYAEPTAKRISYFRKIKNCLFFRTNRIDESLGGIGTTLLIIRQRFI